MRGNTKRDRMKPPTLIAVISVLIPLSASAQVIKVTEAVGRTNVRAGSVKQIGQTVRTYEGKAIGIYEYQGGRWTLFPDSAFKLEMAGKCENGGRVTMFIINGVMEWKWPKNFLVSCSTVKFKTPEAIYRIGGTAFRIDSSKGVTLLGVTNGLTSASAQDVTQYVPGGYYNTTKAGEPPGPPLPISLVGFEYVGRPSAGTQKVKLPRGNRAMLKDKLVSGSIDVPMNSVVTIVAPDGGTKSSIVEPQWAK
jgi:hypothetical protein